MVPREYSNECIVSRPTPYNIPPERHGGSYARTGKLDIGRVVWTRAPLTDPASMGSACVPAFIEGLGEVELDPKCLRPF